MRRNIIFTKWLMELGLTQGTTHWVLSVISNWQKLCHLSRAAWPIAENVLVILWKFMNERFIKEKKSTGIEQDWSMKCRVLSHRVARNSSLLSPPAGVTPVGEPYL